ncbi:MAG: hypothetical protein WAU01_09370, partial [Saprospiraceae bacterium]
MNFLAHMLLSCKDADLMTGNFMADFIPKSFIDHLTPSVRLGIDLHRQIDSFTDQHPEVKASVMIFRPTQRKYAPVVVDIVFD